MPAGFLVTWLPYSPDPSYQQWLQNLGIIHGLQLQTLLAEQRRSGIARGVAVFLKGSTLSGHSLSVNASQATSHLQHDYTPCAAETQSAGGRRTLHTDATQRHLAKQLAVVEVEQHDMSEANGALSHHPALQVEPSGNAPAAKAAESTSALPPDALAIDSNISPQPAAVQSVRRLNMEAARGPHVDLHMQGMCSTSHIKRATATVDACR